MSSIAFNHIAINCKDPILVERFYTKHFGFRRSRVYLPGPGQVVVIKSGPLALELFPSKGDRPSLVERDGTEYPGVRHVAFLVGDLDAKLKAMGSDAKLSLGPLDMSQFIPGMRVAWIADPEGNIVELNQGYVDEPNPPALS
jgi:glyoxylase I family protein